MLAVSGAPVRYSNGADVTVTVAIRGAAVGILVDRFIGAISELSHVAAKHLSKVVSHGCHTAELRHEQSEET